MYWNEKLLCTTDQKYSPLGDGYEIWKVLNTNKKTMYL